MKNICWLASKLENTFQGSFLTFENKIALIRLTYSLCEFIPTLDSRNLNVGLVDSNTNTENNKHLDFKHYLVIDNIEQ